MSLLDVKNECGENLKLESAALNLKDRHCNLASNIHEITTPEHTDREGWTFPGIKTINK